MSFLPQIFLLDIALLDTTDIILHLRNFSKSFNFLRFVISYIHVFYLCCGCPVLLSINLKSEIFMNKQPFVLTLLEDKPLSLYFHYIFSQVSCFMLCFHCKLTLHLAFFISDLGKCLAPCSPSQLVSQVLTRIINYINKFCESPDSLQSFDKVGNVISIR